MDSRIKVLANHLATSDASYMAMVTLLDEKGVLSTEEFDKRQTEILEKIKHGLDEMKKYAVNGVSQ
ncbi:hypothetical protein [Paenibacillus antarcticus]|uniref:Uncharacterized protein n=1 Tax=Paenibacillus antarcticus TaxID=253703 RepID=A0A168MWI9_9BACL|nr:hypothetical protein [Paenibacillus antarcticus]OAB45131.1 hypothetical protein PBAT_14420 [Paenibacillus antarcticus]